MQLSPEALDEIAQLLDGGAASQALTRIRLAWEPELPAEIRAPLYGLWIQALCETQDANAAVGLAQRATEEFPRDADLWTALGNVYESLDAVESALKAFQSALQLAPQSALAHYNVGALLERKDLGERAEEHFRRALDGLDDSAPMPEVVTALGALLRRRGDLRAAAKVYDEFLQEEPLNTEILVEHGICLSDLDAYEEAIQRFRQALDFDRRSANALYNLGVTYYRMGQLDQGIETMIEAYRADPHNILTQAVLGGWLLCDNNRDPDWALQLLYRAQELVTERYDDGLVHENYASIVMEEIFDSLWSSGRCQAAKEIAKIAGRRDWITPYILDTLNREEHKRAFGNKVFAVTARAVLNSEHDTGDIPVHAQGYTTALTVVADDEEQARAMTIEYLNELDPVATLELDVQPLSQGAALEAVPRTCGVTQVSGRSFFPLPPSSSGSPNQP